MNKKNSSSSFLSLWETRLLDMGFEKPVAEILEFVKKNRDKDAVRLRTCLISATLPSKVQKLAAVSLQNPKEVNAIEESKEDKEKETFKTPSQLKQHFVEVPLKQRLVALAALLRWKTSG
jgi:ATP-dependent RNA helicase DDX31/DBP7